MSNCEGNCSSCDSKGSCGIEKEKQNEYSNIKKIIAVVSGKGGVGKSMVTSLLAAQCAKNGSKVAILDADITGPSIPKMFGIKEKAEGDGQYIYPIKSQGGVRIMSMNLLLGEDSDPVIWRGPVIAGAVKQFFTDVAWGDVDYMFVDMPPGTGDVPLTVFQSLPLTGIVIVTSPQDLVSSIVEKAVNMAHKMDIPILGIVENYSYYTCPTCGEKLKIFGESKIDGVAKKHNITVVERLPLQQSLATAADEGLIEMTDTTIISNVLNKIL